ncbi:dihydrolipoyllysine-residue acetyltransferase [Luteimonas sp. WGS1318]|uniref:dihydrolipoyllysine-residue acetyltransferase n=1 Tax=Luteimonas sp. WGS1318 TaxID=3366815 RepID=UPI00372D663D
MADLKEARVPDIGGYDDVPVIEVLVAVGDTVEADQGLVTLESDKATMEVPAPFAGVIKELKVKVGDTLSEGGVVAIIEAEGGDAQAEAPAKTEAPKAAEKPVAEKAAPASNTEAPKAKSGGGGAQESKVPDIGGYDDVPVIEVLVAVGDTVEKDQGLITLESDKATMEVPAAVAGVIKELKVKVGDTLSEGAVVAIIEAAGDAPAAASAPAAAPAKGTDDNTVEPVAAQAKPDKIAEASIEHRVPGSGNPPVRFDADAILPDKVPYASPAVRLFARELGVDLLQLKGSAKGGRIIREDVQAFVKNALQNGGGKTASGAPASAGGGLNLLPWPKVDFAKFGEIEVQELGRIQKISAANLARNWAMIPHVTQHDDADITDLEALRVQLNKENEKAGVKLTMLAFLIKASVAVLKQYPRFNSSLDASGENLTLKKYFHIGFAADTPNGLVVPVIRDADKKGVMEISQEMSALAKKARDGKLGPADMQGGCFSISSLGGIGGTSFTPIVNAPEVAILGVSKSAMKPVWDGKAFQPRLTLPLSLSYDHRVIDGAAAARFTATLAQLLGDMRRVLL